MESGRFSGKEHLHQQPHEQFQSAETCWCRGATSLGEVKFVQDLMAWLKPSIGEEVEKALIRVLQPYLALMQKSAFPPNSSSLPHQAESSASRCFKLQFKGDIPDELLTMTKLEDEGTSLEVELIDDSGKRVEVGSESCLKIKLDVLAGDFHVEDKLDWTQEDYNNNIAKPRNTKGELLKGKNKIALSKGVANVGHICFTDNSKSMRNGTFRLGATALEGLPHGVVVKAAVSEPFRVKERRLKSDRKHKEPSAEDELWRLVYIRKNGAVHDRALKAGIHRVKDFLQRYDTNAQELQQILGVPEANWNAIVKNAKACKLPDVAGENYLNNVDSKNYVQISDQQQQKRQGHEHKLQPTFDACSLMSNQICSIPPPNTDATETDQGSMLGAFGPEDYEQLEASMEDADWEQLRELLVFTPVREERNNVPEVTSKLIAACYVTKAAALFMISIQQDSNAPKKKRKLH